MDYALVSHFYTEGWQRLYFDCVCVCFPTSIPNVSAVDPGNDSQASASVGDMWE